MTRYFFSLLMFALFSSIIPASAETTVQGNFLSMAACPDNSVLLLSDDNQIVKVKPDGSTSIVKLPSLTEEGKGARFSDLAVNDSVITLCRFQAPRLYSIDLKKPENYTIIKPEKLLKEGIKLLSICTSKKGFLALDADGKTFEITTTGEVTQLSEDATMYSTPEGEPVQVKISNPGKYDEKILVAAQSGKEIFTFTPPDSVNKILNFGIIGFDKQGRLISFSDIGIGDKGAKFSLMASKDGKIVASKEISAPEELFAVRSHVLMPDGKICIMRSTSGGNGVVLSWITL
ncbi:MAG: hypothetical protein HQM08_08095 [Candidatus Riflebacteria bacterium]|nr:hypothetical protein [Candidatus Riflebacteria bacterium]